MIYLLPLCPLRRKYCTVDWPLCNRVSKLLSLFCISESRHFTSSFNCWQGKWNGIKMQNSHACHIQFAFLAGFSLVSEFSLGCDLQESLTILNRFFRKGNNVYVVYWKSTCISFSHGHYNYFFSFLNIIQALEERCIKTTILQNYIVIFLNTVFLFKQCTRCSLVPSLWRWFLSLTVFSHQTINQLLFVPR